MNGQIRQKSEDNTLNKKMFPEYEWYMFSSSHIPNSVIHESGTFQNPSSLHHYLQCLWQKTLTTTCLLHIALDKNYHISPHS